jgi:hypothetical protein
VEFVALDGANWPPALKEVSCITAGAAPSHPSSKPVLRDSLLLIVFVTADKSLLLSLFAPKLTYLWGEADVVALASRRARKAFVAADNR